MRLPSMLLLLTVLPLLSACTAPTLDPTAPGDHRLALKLFAKTTDFRITYFELTEAGELAFAGGQNAGQRVAKPIGAITPEDKQQLLDIIAKYQLLQAQGTFLAQGDKVIYETDLTIDGYSHRINCGDDQIDGIRQLHDVLFKIQARMRYQKIPGLK